jgi:hypothetical protein
MVAVPTSKLRLAEASCTVMAALLERVVARASCAALSGVRGVARGCGGGGGAAAGLGSGAGADADGLGARGAIGAGDVTVWALEGAEPASGPAEASRNSSDSFGISFAPIPRRSRQFRLSSSEPLVEF